MILLSFLLTSITIYRRWKPTTDVISIVMTSGSSWPAMMSKQYNQMDLTFPSVVINASKRKRRKRRRNFRFYRFLSIIGGCLVLLFHFIDSTILRLPPPEKKIDFSNVKSVSELSVENIESWCFLVSKHIFVPCRDSACYLISHF